MSHEDVINLYMDDLLIFSFPRQEMKKYKKYFKLDGIRIEDSDGQVLNHIKLREGEDEAV